MRIEFGPELRGDALCWCATKAADGQPPFRLTGIAPSLGESVFARAAAAARFKGDEKQLAEILAPAFCEAERALLLGLGAAPDALAWQRAGATLGRHLVACGAREAGVVGVPPEMAGRLALGVRLGAYRFHDYRPGLSEVARVRLETVRIVSTAGAPRGAEALTGLGDGILLARALVSEPPNVLHPEAFAQRAAKLAELGVDVSILGETQLEALGMAAMLGVGQGSRRASQLVILRWLRAADPEAPPLVLVGKGVTFDSGGISIKPAAGMEAMKGDMAGAAAVVGAMHSLAARKARANVVGLIGLVENMPDGNALRPGDILRSAAGKTIEVVNTDAEGRLVLCDLLHHAQREFAPRAIVDLATLTGAIIGALGHERAGLFANDDGLAGQIAAAGEASGEPLWRLPLDPAYDKLIDSDVADVKNSANGGAGSITAAKFLERFVGEGLPWVHLDIAGTAWKSKSNNAWEPGWATGFGVHLLDRLVADHFEDGA